MAEMLQEWTPTSEIAESCDQIAPKMGQDFSETSDRKYRVAISAIVPISEVGLGRGIVSCVAPIFLGFPPWRLPGPSKGKSSHHNDQNAYILFWVIHFLKIAVTITMF